MTVTGKPSLRIVATHLPTGATGSAQHSGFKDARFADMRSSAVKVAVSKGLASQPGPPRLVRDYDLTGPDAQEVKGMLDGNAPVDFWRADAGTID